MKAVLCLTILAMAFAIILSSTPECRKCLEHCYIDAKGCGTNKPTCTPDIIDKKIRNYNAVDEYWICFQGNVNASARRCRDYHLFSEEVGECVPKNQYIITCPCDTCGC